MTTTAIESALDRVTAVSALVIGALMSVTVLLALI